METTDLGAGISNPAAFGECGGERQVPDSCEAKSTSELSQLAAGGCCDAFAFLAAQLRPRMVSFLLQRVGCQQDAEDIASDAVLKAWRHRGQYDGRCQFSTWLYTIAKRLAVDHYRKASRRSAKHATQADSALAIANTAAAKEVTTQPPDKQDNIWGLASECLTPDQYSALWLKYAEDMSASEIASVLGKTQVGTRVLLHRGRSKLEKRLKRDGDSMQPRGRS